MAEICNYPVKNKLGWNVAFRIFSKIKTSIC